MTYDFCSSAKGEFGKLLAYFITYDTGTMKDAAWKIGLHPYVISKHIHMKKRPRHSSIMLYAEYLMLDPGDIANMIDNDWRKRDEDS